MIEELVCVVVVVAAASSLLRCRVLNEMLYATAAILGRESEKEQPDTRGGEAVLLARGSGSIIRTISIVDVQPKLVWLVKSKVTFPAPLPSLTANKMYVECWLSTQWARVINQL